MASIIDNDDIKALELWTAIKKLYASRNTQGLIKLNQDLEKRKSEDGLDKYMQKFNGIACQLFSFDAPVKEEEKYSKLIRTLQGSFAPLAMVFQTSNMS